MRIDTLHITQIYSGLLACSNLSGYNQRYISSLEEHIFAIIPKHTPLHTIIPSTAPDSLPSYLCIILLHGEPNNRAIDQRCDESGEEYHGFWLAVAQFIDPLDPSSIEDAINIAKGCFDEHAQGYFF